MFVLSSVASHTTNATVKATKNQVWDQSSHKYISPLAEIILWAALKINLFDLIKSEETSLPQYCTVEEDLTGLCFEHLDMWIGLENVKLKIMIKILTEPVIWSLFLYLKINKWPLHFQAVSWDVTIAVGIGQEHWITKNCSHNKG